ncbi:MAG: hypothetical protein AAGC74_11355, partial [Verrucomicrobiota bacterium]
MSFELSEKALMEMGGWKVMKEARAIWRAGGAREAKFENGVLEAKMKGTGKTGMVRARIRSASDVENLCGCRMARREGAVCEHVIAAGLEVLDARSAAEEAVVEEKVVVSEDWPEWVVEERKGARAVRLAVLLPVKVERAWDAGQLQVGVEVEDVESGERVMLNGCRGEVLFVSEADAAVLEVLQAMSPQEVPGVGFLGRELFLQLLSGLAGHGRVMLGRKEEVR